VRTPAVGLLFLVFIGKGRGTRPTMQVEGDDIGSGESAPCGRSVKKSS